MSGCIVRADLAGYQSTQIQLAKRSMFDNPNIGEVVLTRLEGITGHAISSTISAAPKKAVKSYEWAVKEGKKPRLNLKKMAERLESALTENQDFAAAWDLLGQVRLGLGLNEDAIEAFKQAAAGDADFYPVYSRLVPLLVRSGDMAGTIEFGTKALELNTHLDDVRFFLTGAQLRSGQNEAAIKTALEMIERDAVSEYPQAYQFLGAAYANTGDFASSAKYFRQFLKASPNATASNPIQKQLDEWVKNGVVSPAN
jgi:tetratricopeptide (TPR) repeat protein